MQNRSLSGLALGAALAIVSSSDIARAETKRANPVAAAVEAYSYQFIDDPLQAGGLGDIGTTVVHRSQPVRVMLLRPRVAFVAEMLKSVESM